MRTSTSTVKLDGIGPVPVTFTESGDGHPFLLLHGGAGPQSVAGFANLLAGPGRLASSPPPTPVSMPPPAPTSSTALRLWAASIRA